MHSWHQLRASFAAARTILTIFITAGSGYFGSTYSTVITEPGQWYADETPIPGATGTTYVLEALYEGKAITFRTAGFTSNKIKMHTPDQIANLIGWWDASRVDLMALGVSDSIIGWTSKLAGGSEWAQATESLRPNYSATGRNSKPAAIIALGDYMTAASAASLPSGTATSHMFGLMFHSAVAAGEWATVAIWGTANATARANAILNNSTALPGNSQGTAGTANFLGSPAWLNADHMFSSLFTATTMDFWLDGQFNVSRAATINSSAATTNRLFGHNFVSGRWPGACHDLFIYGAALGTDDRQKNEGYLAHKWGYTSLLPSGHPYKTNPPRTF